MAVRLYASKGRALRGGKAPLRWGAGERKTPVLSRLSEGRIFFPKNAGRQSLLLVVLCCPIALRDEAETTPSGDAPNQDISGPAYN